jgi:cobalt-zinc-cadmium resistance protein CzcA
LAKKAASELNAFDNMSGVHIVHVLGRVGLEFRVDPDKCKRWGVSAADVKNVIQTALGSKAVAMMIEGDKTFRVTVRWPGWRRSNQTSLLDIPVDITDSPAPAGKRQVVTGTPRLRLRDLVSPLGDEGRQSAVVIYREEGRRFIAVRFRPRGADVAATLAALRKKLAPLFAAPYRAQWEFTP